MNGFREKYHELMMISKCLETERLETRTITGYAEVCFDKVHLFVDCMDRNGQQLEIQAKSLTFFEDKPVSTINLREIERNRSRHL
jgi:hypothetical protein